ncbi:MAG TPA: hypothetical protein VF054_20835 [Micromonosporaceae bacterium]
MRRLLACTAVAVTVLLPVAACGPTSPGDSAASAHPSVAASPSAPGASASASPGTTPAAAASANTKQVCAAAEHVVADSTSKFAADLVQAAQAGMSGDRTAQDKALQSVKALLATWSSGLGTQAAKATDPDLKAALADMAAAIDRTNAQLRTVDDLASVDLDSNGFKAASDKLAKLCG